MGDHEVADAARFEGAGWLKIFELEVDIAETSAGVIYKLRNYETHQSVACDNASERIRGVVIHGCG